MSNQLPTNPTTNTSNNTTIQITNNNDTVHWIVIILVFIVAGLTIGIGVGWFLQNNQKTNTLVSKQTSQTHEPFKIGFISPLSGDGASYGVPAKQAAEVVAKEINEKGGIGGRKIQLEIEDGRCSEVDAKAAGEKLINEKKVDLLYGGECSDEFLAVAPLAQRNKILTVSASTTSPKIAELGKYIFRTIPSDNLAGKAAAQYAKTKMEASTAAVIYENTSYGKQLAEVFSKEYEKAGGKIILTADFDPGETKFTEFISDMKKLQPQLIYMVPQTPTPGVLIVKGLKENKINVKMLTAEVLLTRDEVQKQGTVLDDVVGIEAYVNESDEKAKQVIELYKNEYGQDSQYPTDLVAIRDLFYLYKEAYEKVGNDPDKINDYLHSLKNWDGAAGDITFDKNGDVISLPYAIQRIKGRKVTLIETFKVN